MSEPAISDQIKGRVKEAVGSLLDDEDLKREGRTDQAAGKVKGAAEEAVDEVKNSLTGRGNE